jgi:hypothetical protein
MEEMESPTEQAQEDMHHHAMHSTEKWIGWVALTAAFLAALAAVTGSMSGHHANEAMLEQIHAADTWTEYQAQKQKALIMSSKDELLVAMGKPVSEADHKSLEGRAEKQEKLQEKAKELDASATAHMNHHHVLAEGATSFQVGIAIAAVSVLSKRKQFWFVSIAFGAVGLFFLVSSFFMK